MIRKFEVLQLTSDKEIEGYLVGSEIVYSTCSFYAFVAGGARLGLVRGLTQCGSKAEVWYNEEEAQQYADKLNGKAA